MKATNPASMYYFDSNIYDFTRQFTLFGRRKAITALKLDKNDTIIDFACGTGLNTPLLASQLAQGEKAVIGVDFSEPMLRKHKKKYPSALRVQADLATYSSEILFDKAICSYGLVIIDEWKKSIASMAKCLSAEGTLVILDLQPWTKPFAWFYKTLGMPWFRLHGANTDIDIEGELSKHFKSVTKTSYLFGYYCIFVARIPKK